MLHLDDFDCVLFDLDGTVYRGSKIIPGANDAVKMFRKEGKSNFFTTNNSTHTQHQIYLKLKGLGIDCVEEEIITSGLLAVNYVKRNQIEKIYIMGSDDLKYEFEKSGIPICKEDEARNLIIGYSQILDYDSLAEAIRVAIKANCIIACNKERVFPGEKGILLPGCGAMVASIEWCAGKQCDVIIGKPETLVIEYLVERFSVSPERILVIGDTYESDVLMARKAGCKSIFISRANDYSIEPNIYCISDISRISWCFDG